MLLLLRDSSWLTSAPNSVTTTGSGDVAAEIAELADITEFSVVDILAEQTVGSDTLEADVAGLEPGTLVTARVLAECSGGRSEWSMAGAPVRVAKGELLPPSYNGTHPA